MSQSLEIIPQVYGPYQPVHITQICDLGYARGWDFTGSEELMLQDLHQQRIRSQEIMKAGEIEEGEILYNYVGGEFLRLMNLEFCESRLYALCAKAKF